MRLNFSVSINKGVFQQFLAQKVHSFFFQYGFSDQCLQNRNIYLTRTIQIFDVPVLYHRVLTVDQLFCLIDFFLSWRGGGGNITERNPLLNVSSFLL